MLNKEQLYEIIDFVLAEARGYDTRVLVQGSEQGLTRFANSEIHQNIFESNLSVTITVTSGHKRSQQSTNLCDEAGLRSVAAETISNLTFLPEGEEQPKLVALPPEIVSDTFNAPLAERFSIERRAREVAAGLVMLAPGYNAYGALSHTESTLAIGNSCGIKRFARHNQVNISVLVADSSGGSGYAKGVGSTADFFAGSFFQVAYEKARLNSNPVSLEPGAYTVILEPLAVGDLLQYMSLLGFSGRAVLNQSSFLTNRIGEQVFGENVTIMDDYTDPNTRYFPFDFHGEARQVVSLVENGVAKGLVYDANSALKAGVASTGHSVDMPQYGGIAMNLVMVGGEKPLAEIIKETKDALLVTRFHYMNAVNPRQAQLTALTRDGFFKIEDGKIVSAVANMRFTESMLKAFNNISEISGDRVRVASFFGNIYVPGLKITDFCFTGKTN